jgi:hypothetical protein
MEKLVQQYLFEYYYIDTSEIGNDGIYYKLNQNKWKSPHNYSLLLKEINTVFGIEEVLIKLIINDWAVSEKQDVDLEFYWTTLEDLIGFPIVQRVAARTMGMDIVSVMPLSAPTGQLMYMDYQYGDFIPETTTPEINIAVNDRDDSIVYRELQKWSSIISSIKKED